MEGVLPASATSRSSSLWSRHPALFFSTVMWITFCPDGLFSSEESKHWDRIVPTPCKLSFMAASRSERPSLSSMYAHENE